MTEITLPNDPYARSAVWKLVRPTQANISEWTGARQVMSSGRGWWECRYELPPIVGEDDQRPFKAFVAKAKGMVNTFRVYPHHSNQTVFFNTVRVNGAGQTGTTLASDGWPSNSVVMEAGQYITVDGQLLRLTANVSSTIGGAATLAFEPPLRAAPADNATIEYNQPYALMYLQEEPEEGFGLGDVYTLTLNLREAF